MKKIDASEMKKAMLLGIASGLALASQGFVDLTANESSSQVLAGGKCGGGSCGAVAERPVPSRATSGYYSPQGSCGAPSAPSAGCQAQRANVAPQAGCQAQPQWEGEYVTDVGHPVNTVSPSTTYPSSVPPQAQRPGQAPYTQTQEPNSWNGTQPTSPGGAQKQAPKPIQGSWTPPGK